jgi:predicted NUDIX family NTP pyrophosphohydrolase
MWLVIPPMVNTVATSAAMGKAYTMNSGSWYTYESATVGMESPRSTYLSRLSVRSVITNSSGSPSTSSTKVRRYCQPT